MTAGRLVAAAIGTSLALSAIATSNSGIEHTLGRAPGELAWGPALFRALLALHGILLLVIAVCGTTRNNSPSSPIFGPEDRSAVRILGLLTLAAFALRLWRADTSLWLDEILTMVDFARPSLSTIVTSFPNQNQHMLVSLMAHCSLVLFGESAWALRLPSVLFGVASIWALYLLGRKMNGSRTALFACTLMTVSYHHVWFSQNARGYMGVAFFSILATWLWLEAMDRKHFRWWAAYSFALFLGIWIHMTMVFLIAGHGLVWLADGLRTRRPDWRPVAAWLLCGSLAAQALALALPEFFRSALHEVSMPSEWTNPLWVLTESMRSLRVGFAGIAVVLGAAATVLAGWFAILRRQPRAAAAMVLPALIGGSAMIGLGHNLWPRFFFFSVGFALLIAVQGAMTMPQLLPLAPRLRARYGTALALLLIIASTAMLPRCYALPKQDFTGAREYVEHLRTPGDAVVVIGLARHAFGKYYAPHWTEIDNTTELERVKREHARIALVFTLPIELKAFQPQLWAMVTRDFEPVKVFPGTLGGGEVYVCRARAANDVRAGAVRLDQVAADQLQ
jgi:hypothetical protein